MTAMLVRAQATAWWMANSTFSKSSSGPESMTANGDQNQTVAMWSALPRSSKSALVAVTTVAP